MNKDQLFSETIKVKKINAVSDRRFGDDFEGFVRILRASSFGELNDEFFVGG